MKKLIAILMVLVLLPVVAFGETASGVRMSVSNIAVTVGEKSFAPDITANIDEVVWEDGSLAGFFMTLGDQTLLPVQAKLDASGVSLKLGGSMVYCFTPEWFEGLSGEDNISEVFALMVAPATVNAMDVAHGFEAFLGAQEGDSFALSQEAVLGWLEGAMNLQEGTFAAIMEGPVLPELKVDRVENGYEIDWEDFDGAVKVIREGDVLSYCVDDAEESICAKFSDSGAIEADYSYALKTEYGYENITAIDYDYSPKAEGGAEYSLLIRDETTYDHVDYYSDNSVDVISVNGTVDESGAHSAHVTFSENLEMGPDVSAEFNVTVESAQVEDNITGKKVTTVNDYTDDSLNYLMFAAMGLMGDVEKLMSDSEIAGIMETYTELDNAAYDAWLAREEEEPELTVEDLVFELPEFTYLPDGFAPDGDPYINYDGTSYSQRYVNEEGNSFTIHIQDAVGLTYYYTYSQGESMDRIREHVLQYKGEDGYFHGELTENGLSISIYSYNMRMTPAEVRAILDGRVWSE